MSEENEVIEPQDNTPAEGEENTTPEPKNTETDDKARRMGWVPKDEFRGDPAKWRPADEFVKRGEDQLPILRERLRHQDKQLAELQKSMKEFAEYHTKTEQRSYERAIEDLKARQAQAVAASDGQAFLDIGAEIERISNDAALKQAPSVKEQAPDDAPAFKAWKSANAWYEKDDEMTSFADNIGAHLYRTKGLEGDKLFEAVTEKVKREFPEKFENPRRNAAPAVEGSSPQRKTGKGYADLPAEARAACERMAKNAYGDNPEQAKKFKEQYVKQYFEE